MDLSTVYSGLRLVTGPSAEPLSLADAKTHLGVDQTFTDDDAYITDLITLARQTVEPILRRALLTQTWRLSLRNWPGRDYQNWPTSQTMDLDTYYKFNHVKLPFAPLQSVTSVNYMTSDGQTLSMVPANFQPNVANSYNVDTEPEPGRIVLPFSAVWPTEILMPGAPIQITYVAGYLDLSTLQQKFEGYTATVRAIKEIVGYSYEYRIPPSEIRKSNVPAGIELVVDSLLTPYRIWE